MNTSMMRPRDVAGELGLSPVRVYALIRQGVIPATRVGGAIRIPRQAWETWLSERTNDALGIADVEDDPLTH